jgi:SNF2 family DNA or RNA helicase
VIALTEISPPRKCSGLSSFLVSFAWNPAAVEALKTLPSWYWHKSDKVWEIPAHDLAKAIDLLTVFDSIELRLLKDTFAEAEGGKLTDAEIEAFGFEPFPHQVSGIEYGLDPRHGKFLLLDSMGLGKSLEIVGLAETLKRRGSIDHCLIVCGVDSLRQNWKREIKRFSKESVMVLGEKIAKTGRVSYATIPERCRILREPIEEFFVVVNAATLRHDEFVEAFRKSKNRFGMIAVDEIHRFATKTSQQGTNLLKLKADHKVGATGTLLINSPVSCYMPLAWTENDMSTLTMFKSEYCEFGGFGDRQIVGYKNLDWLKEELAACSIRRTLEEVREGMPPKNVQYELVEMADDHRRFYEAVKAGVKEEADKVELNPANLLALTTRLRQATADPGILTTSGVESSKLIRCAEIARDLISQGEKVVVFSTFKEPVYRLAEMLSDCSPLIGTGDFRDQDVQDRMVRFQEDPSAKLFIGTHSKCGTGYTLNAASYMITIDQPYTWAAFSQSTDRIWRITNDRPAFVISLVCADSIDERVREIVETKKDLSDYLVDGKANSCSRELADALRSAILDL